MVNQICLLFSVIFVLMGQTGAQLTGDYSDMEYDDDIFVINQTMIVTPSTPKKNLASTRPSSSTIIKRLTTRQLSSNKSAIFSQNGSSFSLSTTSNTPQTTPTTTTLAPFILANRLVDQFNHYRNIDILVRIKQCDPHFKLNNMCETYSIDNHTNSLVRQAPIDFQSLQHVYDALIDRTVVLKLYKFCAAGHWCLANMTIEDVHYTEEVIRKRGGSFCSLEQCQHRLVTHVTSCPSILTKNVTTPTLRLLPMLCTLHREQKNWTSTKCVEEIVNLLHLLYAFWPQIETCHQLISAGVGGCTVNCRTFSDVFIKMEDRCPGSASFLTRVPSLAWYRSINMQQMCRPKLLPIKSSSVSSIRDFFTYDSLSHQIHQRSVYTTLFILVFICIVVSFSVCLYYISQNDNDSNSRRLDDDYEYTRLHNSTFELGTETEITNENPTTNGMISDSQGRLRPSEYQRLLHGEV